MTQWQPYSDPIIFPGDIGNPALAGVSAGCSRFIMFNGIYRQDGKLRASVASSGGWLNLAEWKLVVTPEGLQAALNRLHRTPDLVVLEFSIKD